MDGGAPADLLFVDTWPGGLDSRLGRRCGNCLTLSSSVLASVGCTVSVLVILVSVGARALSAIEAICACCMSAAGITIETLRCVVRVVAWAMLVSFPFANILA